MIINKGTSATVGSCQLCNRYCEHDDCRNEYVITAHIVYRLQRECGSLIICEECLEEFLTLYHKRFACKT